MLTRRGATLFEVIITVAILAVIGAAIYISQAAGSALGGQAANVDRAARVLAEIADAEGRITGTGGATSFNQVVGQDKATVSSNASKLSQLTTPITVNDQNSCGYNYLSAEVGRWKTPFYYRIFPTTGILIAPGYYAQDQLIRYNAPGVPTTPANRPAENDARAAGTVAVVMPNTPLQEAVALAARVEGDQGGVLGAVRYFPQDGSSPVTLEYHITVRGC